MRGHYGNQALVGYTERELAVDAAKIVGGGERVGGFSLIGTFQLAIGVMGGILLAKWLEKKKW